MKLSTRIVVCVAVCATFGIGVTAYATTAPKINLSEKVVVNESVIITETIAAVNENDCTRNNTLITDQLISGDTDEQALGSQAIEVEVVECDILPSVELRSSYSRENIPMDGDEICGDYFVHTYSNGEQACVPFNQDAERNYFNVPTSPIDVDALRELGSDTPLNDEVCYSVVEFLDGTKRYFKLGEAPLAFTDPLRYGILYYVEGGFGESYSTVLPSGMAVNEWR